MSKLLKCLFASLFLILGYSLSFGSGTNYFVNAATGDNGSAGTSSGAAFKTITHALSVAASGDIINVAAGTYNMALGEVFPLAMVSGVTLTGTAGAATTIIDATGANARVITCSANANTTVIQGFTITGGNNVGNVDTNFTAKGGGLYCDNGDQTIIRKNIITGNTAIGYNGLDPAGSGFRNGGNANGGGIYVGSASPSIVNNVISNNTVQGGIGWSYNGGTSTQAYNGGAAVGGGIDASFSNAMTIANNTVYGNASNGGNGGATNSSAFARPDGGNGTAGGISAGSNVVVLNNIFVNNSCIGGNPGSGGFGGNFGNATNGALSSSTDANLSYNLYFNNSATTEPNGGTLGSNNVLGSDPLFVSTSNYHFTNTSSPAYHAGTATGAPATDFDGAARNNPPSIGAFESTDPLPVQLASLSARPHRLSAEVSWSTMTEVGCYGFEVERKAVSGQQSAVSDWTSVGFVQGAGTSAILRTYAYVDITPGAGRYAYRIKQIDNNGSFHYYGNTEVEVGLVAKEFKLEAAYPNPFNPSTNIEFVLSDDGPASLKIFNVLGQQVSELFHGTAEAGTLYKTRFDASSMPSGVYFARLEAGGQQSIRKLVYAR